MTQELFQMIQRMDSQNIELQLAMQCAPLIAGLKISNLLILPDCHGHLLKAILDKTGISYYRLLKAKGNLIFLLFCRASLEEFLGKEDVRENFIQEGYQAFWLGGLLRTFRIRYQAYMDGIEPFPHELGLLLGYPVEDVRGFVENEGKNFLYSGYWKVYCGLEEKRILFRKFEYAQEILIQLVSAGIGIEVILKLRKERIEQEKRKETKSYKMGIGTDCEKGGCI